MSLVGKGMTAVANISSTSGSNLTLEYSTPLRASSPTQTISSTFPALLGSKDTNGSLVGQAYGGVQGAGNTVGLMAASVDSIVGNSGNYSNYTSRIISDANRTSDSLFQSQLLINDIFSSVPFSPALQNLELIVYGVIGGLVSLLLVAMLCFLKWDKMGCRHFIYLFGFFLFLAALFCFGCGILLGFTSALSYSGCHYLDHALSDPAALTSSFQKLGTDPQAASQLSVCLLGQSGDIIGSVSGTASSAFVGNLSSAMNSIVGFNGTQLVSTVDLSYQPLQLQVAAYSQSQVLDIVDQSAIDELKFVSNPGNYFTCTQGHFQADSWVPHSAIPAVPCTAPPPQSSADNASCPNSLSFLAQASGCTGCMSTYSLLYSFNSSAEVSAHLKARYTDCSAFATDLANIWKNYYLVKKNTLEPVVTREQYAQQAVQAVNQDLTTNVDPLVSNTITQLYSSS
jgi:hypothetical protein